MKQLENTLIQISQNGMGTGDEELGLILVNNYIKLLFAEQRVPRFIALYNEGVKLICKGSSAIEHFKALEGAGTKIIACKTCLNHFEMLDKVGVGIAGTMIDIIELQGLAHKVINL